MPTSETERAASVAEAAKRPAVYAALVEKYAGHALPTMLPNLLVREHGIFAGSSEQAARAFRETMEYAGLLRNGILFTDPTAESRSQQGDQTNAETPPRVTDSASSGNMPMLTLQATGTVGASAGTTQTFNIPLDRHGRVATIQIPIPFNPRDLSKITAWATYMSTTIVDDEGTPDISSN